MSWSSDCKEYCEEIREKVREGKRIDKQILDINLMILECLSAIADMLEEKQVVIMPQPDLPKDYPPITAVYAAPDYPMNYAVDVTMQKGDSDETN